MEVIFTILYILIGVVVTGLVGRNLYVRRELGVGTRKRKALSEPSKIILANYRELPKEAREIDGMYDMLAAMDFKYDKDEVTSHFQNRQRTWDGVSIKFTWSCRCYSDRCPYKEYVNIKKGVEKIHNALAEREKAVALVNRTPALENASSLAERLNEEATAISKSVEGLK